MSQNIEELKKEFLEYLEVERGRSIKTIENYDHYLKRFLEFSKIKEVREITDDIIREYRLRLNRLQPELNRKTQNYHLIALRAFLKYLAKRDIEALAPEKIELAKVAERDLDLISESELERLLQSPDGNEIKDLRDKAILELLFSTGLRVSELCNLNIDSVDLQRDEFSVRGKGEKVRLVFLSDEAKLSLKNYLDKRVDMDEALFVRIRNNELRVKSEADGNGSRRISLSDRPKENRSLGATMRLTPRSIERIIKYYAIKAGISKKVTPHIIRHCFATDLLSNGADIRSVQSLLGHSNISTTQIYTHVTDKQLHDVHKAFHGKRRK